MTTLRPSPFSPDQIWLREFLTNRRKELGLSQRALAERLGVIYSFVAKVETGDRRLDVSAFVHYCRGLELDPCNTLKLLEQHCINRNSTKKTQF